MILLAAAQGQGQILLSWLNRRKLVTLMNGWTELRHNIRKQLKINTKSVQRPSSKPVAGFAIIYVLFNAAIGCILASFVPPHPQRHLEMAYFTLMLSYFGFAEVLVDAKVLLIFTALRANFTQVSMPT